MTYSKPYSNHAENFIFLNPRQKIATIEQKGASAMFQKTKTFSVGLIIPLIFYIILQH